VDPVKAASPPNVSTVATPIADMVAQLLDANMPRDAIVLAIAAVERTVAVVCAPPTGMSTMPPDGQVDAKQKKTLRERLKKRRYRAKLKAKRENSPPASNGGQVDASTAPVVDVVDMSTSRALSLSSSPSKKEKREARARAKPSPVDIPVDWQLSPEDERFAADRGFTSAGIADVAIKYKNHRKKGGKRDWQSWVLDERPKPGQRQPPVYEVGGKDDPHGWSDEVWRHKLSFLGGIAWPKQWGPAPGQPGCLVPQTLQLEAKAILKLNEGLKQCMAQ
jgi:hypothetical protein